MTQEQDNFYRHSTVIVDVTKDTFLHILEFHLTNLGITLQAFIKINGHEIYHFYCNIYPCCQCPPGTRAVTKGQRVLQSAQLDILFDKNGSKVRGHKPRSRSAPHCCCPVNPNLQLHDLDFTLARFLLVSFTPFVPPGSPERLALQFLVDSRNNSFAHAKEGKISNCEFQKSMCVLEKSLLVLAKICGKETDTKQRLSYIIRQPLNTTLCLQLQNTLLQQCQIDETIKRFLAEKILPDCLTKDIVDASVTEGCDAHFEIWTKEDDVCTVWSYNGLEIFNSEKFIIKKSRIIHSLDVMNTCLSDKGLYTVRVNDTVRPACLHVEEYYTKNLRNIKCIEGESVEFLCQVIEDSFPACWRKTGIKLENDDKYEMLQTGKTHILRIKNCNINDVGDYTVNINNRVRTTSLSVKAYFTQTMATTVTCMQGENVELKWAILEENVPAIWKKNGIAIQHSEKYIIEDIGKVHMLSIIQTDWQDAGNYTVMINNRVRSAELQIKVHGAEKHMTPEQENAYRHLTVVVDATKDCFQHLLDLHLTNEGITLQRFIEINQHEIYHMCYSLRRCCRCLPFTRDTTRCNRVLHPSKLDKLLDKTGSKLPVHNANSRSSPHCCCPVNLNLQLHDLDFTLARILVVSFTQIMPIGSPERDALDFLLSSMNHWAAPFKEWYMSNSEYHKSMGDVEKSLLLLAKIYRMETQAKQRLSCLVRQPLNTTICQQLHNTLLEQQQLDENIKRLLVEKKLPGNNLNSTLPKIAARKDSLKRSRSDKDRSNEKNPPELSVSLETCNDPTYTYIDHVNRRTPYENNVAKDKKSKEIDLDSTQSSTQKIKDYTKRSYSYSDWNKIKAPLNNVNSTLTRIKKCKDSLKGSRSDPDFRYRNTPHDLSGSWETFDDSTYTYINHVKKQTYYKNPVAHVAESPELPIGWEEIKDPIYGTYYIDHVNRRTQYENPAEHAPELPFGWDEIEDPIYGRYYIDHVNRRTQYKNPVAHAKKSPELPFGWDKIEDPVYGRYYIDHVNKRTQYKNPAKKGIDLDSTQSSTQKINDYTKRYNTDSDWDKGKAYLCCLSC